MIIGFESETVEFKLTTGNRDQYSSRKNRNIQSMIISR